MHYNNNLLSINNLSTGYGKKQVIFNVTFNIDIGEIVLLVGNNGSGKSSLLKAIFGILPQWNEATVIFNGEDITGKSTSTILNKKMLYIPQKNNLFEDLTLRENLEMAGLSLDQKLLHQRIEYVLSVFDILIPNLNRLPMNLSGGERQLLALAMAALHQPRLILLDEPFAGLSLTNIDFVIEYLKILNIQSSTTLLIAEHRIKECLQIANRVIVLKLGRIFNSYFIHPNYDHSKIYQAFI